MSEVEVTEIEDSAPNSPKDQDVGQSPIVVVPSDSEENENPVEPGASYSYTSRKRSHSGRIRQNTDIKMVETLLQISNKIDHFVEVQEQIKQKLEEMLKLVNSYTRAENSAGDKSIMSNAEENEPVDKQKSPEDSNGQETGEIQKSKRGKLAQEKKESKKVGQNNKASNRKRKR